MSDKSTQRFWEFYLVRYLSGAVFGILVVIFLSATYSENINSALSNPNVPNKDNSLTVENIYKTIFESKETVICTKKLNPQWICGEGDGEGVVY